MAITDLTGYTWVGNSNVIVTSASVRTYNINYSITCDNAQYNSSGGTLLNINFTQEYFPPKDENRNIAYIGINTDNYTSFGGIMYQGNGRIYESVYGNTLPATLHLTNNSSFTYVTSITFTGGTDATNPDLIAWLEANGTLTKEEPEPTPTSNIHFGDKIAKLYLGNVAVSKAYLGSELVYGGEEPSSGETWVINESPNVNFGITEFFATFNSDTVSYSKIVLSYTGQAGYIKYNETQVAVYNDITEQYAWSFQSYRTITFETAPTGDLLTWLQANAVKQGGSPN